MVIAQKAPSPVVQLQALAESGAAALRATRTAEDPFNAWYSLAALYASQNDAAGAERSLRAAIAANPNWFKPHWTLAQVLLVEGRVEEAAREAALAAELNAGKNPEVARTLEEIRAQRTGAR
jgi:Tfp pilus assembly protein PilF